MGRVGKRSRLNTVVQERYKDKSDKKTELMVGSGVKS